MATIRVTTEIELDIDTAATWFAELDDDAMCRFLVAIADKVNHWAPGVADNQWYYLGGHLSNCSCSTENARNMIKGWVYWMEHSKHGIKHNAPEPSHDPS